ncbi:MAG: PorT family protein [Prevotella sp.]|nr:PorT family protein [Prevotella sp.]
MPDKRSYNEQPDEFSRLARHKLENYRTPVDADCWNEIELRMKSGQKRSVLWIGGSVAAIAVIVILLLSIPKNDEPPFIPVAGKANFNTTGITVKKPGEQPITANAANNAASAKSLSMPVPDKTGGNKKTVKESNAIHETLPVTIDTASLAYVEDIIRDASPGSNNSMAEANISDITDSIPAAQEEKFVEKIPKEPAGLLTVKSGNNKGKWLASASVSYGNGSSSNGNMYGSMYDYASSANIADLSSGSPLLKNGLSTNDFPVADHSIPLSFGVGIRKDLNKFIGIETGLAYTYLFSKFKKTGAKSYQASQELHYLGIPVNVVVYLYNSHDWNIYLSAGSMVEKGLRYKYTEDIYDKNNNTATVYDKGRINGLQWSLNASLGVSYMLYNDWSIYFEPRFSFYFDNDQPVSIRTEKPSVFGLGAGLRYKF